MTKDQRLFIKSIIKNVEKKILSQKLPKTWDGLQLRWHIADTFQNAIILRKWQHPKESKEYAEYKNQNNLW